MTSRLPNASEGLAGPTHHALRTPRRSRWRTAIAKVNQAWTAVQISHHGKYSIERLIALDEYVRRTSWTRVIALCLITPLPVMVLVLSQESIPLQNPTEGWRVNYGIWIRAGIVSGAVSHSVLVQLQYLVDDVMISTRQLSVMLTIMVLGYTGISVAVADTLFFPIPFMSITMALPFLLLLACAIYFVIGDKAVRQILQHKGQIFRFIVLTTTQTMMIIIYPAYQVLFQAAGGTGYELLVVTLLPILKIVMKNITSLGYYRMQDLMPEGVIFTVDFFNAFYIATSMQTASSTSTVIVIMVVDVFHSTLALNGLRRGTSDMIELLQKAGNLHSNDPREFDLLHVAALLCQSSDEFEAQDCSSIQLRSRVPYEVSVAGKNLLDRLDKNSGQLHPTASLISYVSGRFFARTARRNFAQKWWWNCGNGRSATVHPTVGDNRAEIANYRAKRGEITPRQEENKRPELQEALELLFTSECLVLSEYLESIVPILYANYITVMVRLPSAHYHLEMAGITRDNVDAKIEVVFAYAFLEFLSFVVMATVVQQKCGIRILHHLAFVLEAHMPLIQDKLITWTLLTLASRVVHFGVDFSFRFAWL